MIEWIKEHPYLTGGLGLVLIVLFLVIRNASSNSSTQAAASGPTGTSDSIQALEIQSGAGVAAAQIAANATVSTANAALNAHAIDAQVANLQTLGAVDVSNRQTQAALTLGLANGGQSTMSILQLLDAQLGNFPTLTTVAGNGNFVANPPPVTVTVNTGASGSGSTSVTPSASGGFVPTPTMPWPSSASQGGTIPLNDVADSLALQMQGQPLTAAPTSFLNNYGGNNISIDHSCPPGYIFQNGQCLSPDVSPQVAGDAAELFVSQQWVPVPNNADGSCPPGYSLVNGACYRTH